MSQAVIMAGGQGERFWPLTHKNFPKYRLRFQKKTSLLGATIARLLKVYPKDAIHVVTTREHAPMIREELPGLPSKNWILEPSRRNTAAAIFLTSAKIAARYGPSEVVSFFPADHLIENVALFKRTVREAVRLAQRNKILVTLGICPTFPATGYGYILAGRALTGFQSAFRAKRFVEKPDRKTALKYLKQGTFLWNSGIFTWQAGTLLETIRKTNPGYFHRFSLKDVAGTYHRLPDHSIDTALMEKASNIAVVRTRMDWCDLGSWDMFLDRSQKDSDRNHRAGKRLVCKDSKDMLIVSERCEKPVVVLGVSGLIVVQTDRGVLVCKKGRSEEAALLAKQFIRW